MSILHDNLPEQLNVFNVFSSQKSRLGLRGWIRLELLAIRHKGRQFNAPVERLRQQIYKRYCSHECYSNFYMLTQALTCTFIPWESLLSHVSFRHMDWCVGDVNVLWSFRVSSSVAHGDIIMPAAAVPGPGTSLPHRPHGALWHILYPGH